MNAHDDGHADADGVEGWCCFGAARRGGGIAATTSRQNVVLCI
jgi:hypothetical protein